MTCDRNIVRFIRQDKAGGRIALHQPAERFGNGRVAAHEAVRSQRKNVTKAGNGDSIAFGLERAELHSLGRVAEDDLVDLVEREASDLNPGVGQD
jgi:hypothetical protein